MLHNNIIIIVICTSLLSTLISILIFICGVLLGKSLNKNTIFLDKEITAIEKNKDIIDTIKSVKIDDTKYVTGIDTNNLEKKYESLGEVKKSTENISSSIDKLKNIKK